MGLRRPVRLRVTSGLRFPRVCEHPAMPVMVPGPMEGDGREPERRRRPLVEAVVFDIGETLVDESRAWAVEARRAGVTTLTLFAALGAVIERGMDHREVWGVLGVARPETTMALEPSDLYPDALDCRRALRDTGCRVGIAANQPMGTEELLRSLGLDLDLVASSARWGVEKPAPEFFKRIGEDLGCSLDRVAYVGDRLDNDVVPAADAGMVSVFIRRGPWGLLHSVRPESERADIRIESLADLLPRLRAAGFLPPV